MGKEFCSVVATSGTGFLPSANAIRRNRPRPYIGTITRPSGSDTTPLAGAVQTGQTGDQPGSRPRW
jgi:hypothetical protein